VIIFYSSVHLPELLSFLMRPVTINIMPLVHQATLGTNGLWGIWQIEEPLSVLAQNLVGAENILESNALEQKQRESLAARQLCRHLLQTQGVAYKGLYKDAFGKPFLNHSDWQISLSHCHQVAAAVIHQRQTVGIDIEQPRPQLRRVAPKFLSQQEIDFTQYDLNSLSLVWSAKEALYKLYGRKKLTFKKELSILPFERTGEQGCFEAILKPKNQAQQTFSVHYEAWQHYWLAIVGI